MVAKKKAASKKKAVARKTTAAKKAPAAKKAAAKKVAAKKVVMTPIKEAMTKAQIYMHIAEATGLSKKDVAAVFDEFNTLIERHVKKNAVGEFKVPGLMKVKVIKKPATKARKGINPFTGEETTFKAKPARRAVKVLALKGLKDMAG